MTVEFEELESREYDRKFNWPDEPIGELSLEETRAVFTRNLIQPFRYVFLIGLSCTGKSSFMEAYPGRRNWTVTKWDRDQIMDMIFDDGRRVDKYHQYCDALEKRLFKDLFERTKHQILIESWMSTKGTRTKYMNYMPSNIGRVCAVVFDGPTDKIVERVKENGVIDKPEKEIGMFIEEKHKAFEWPEHDEGINKIFYINTFGAKGTQYFSEVLE